MFFKLDFQNFSGTLKGSCQHPSNFQNILLYIGYQNNMVDNRSLLMSKIVQESVDFKDLY